MKKSIIFDLALLGIYLAAGCYFIVEAYVGGMIPDKYVIMVIIALLVVAILLALSFKLKNKVMQVLRKILLILLSASLIFGGYFQGKLRNALSNVDDGSTSKRLMYVIAASESTAEAIEDIHSIGFRDHASELMTYSLNELKDYNLEEQPYTDTDELLAALDEHKIDAALITDQDYSLKSDQSESFKTDYKTIHTIEMVVQKENTGSNIDLTTKPFVVYISGLDEMGEPTFDGLSDVNMILMIDPVAHHVEIVSVNRDTYVPNPKYNDYPDKLTHLGWQGPEVTVDALERIFGINIDYFAKVTFESLIEIIDTLGGIDVDVQIKFCEQDEHRSFASNDLICLNKGSQHLNGKQALAYARHRKTIGWEVKGREQAQRDIIQAIVSRLLSFDGAMKAADVVEVATKYVATNMPISNAKAFLNNAIDTGADWTFSSYTVESGYEYLYPTASMGTSQDLSCALLSNEDIQYVHNLYTAMTQKDGLSDFSFDLNNMDKFNTEFVTDEKVITVENYYRTVSKYFPSYLREHF